MVSINIERESLFGDESEEDDMPRFAPLPDLDDNENVQTTEAGADDEAGQENLSGVLRDLSKGAGKKRVLKPQPKLDGERLKSAKGLPALPTLFTNTKFKGPGHEAEDLDVVMKGLEHWAHRLFPKLKFNDFIERMERLGQKRDVRTCMNRIRMDLDVNDGDGVNKDGGSDKEDDDNMLQAASVSVPAHISHMSSDEELDDAARAMSSASKQLSPVHRSDANITAILSPAAASSASPAAPTTPSVEQLERIERNKRLALEKRAARLGVSVASLSQTPAANNTNASLDNSMDI